ncbi:MAG: ion channel [Planctomycetota bacterium]
MEYPNHFFFAPGRIPAWFVDSYLLIWLGILTAASAALNTEQYRAVDFSVGWTFFAWFCALQVVQVNVHRNVWRRITHNDGGLPRIYGRNLVNGLIGFVMMNWFFGIAYWLERASLDPQPTSVLHAIYLGFISGTTIGYGEIHPETDNPATLILWISMSHTLLSLVMIAVAIGATVTTIEPKGQQAD